jgi:hypothetical protein
MRKQEKRDLDLSRLCCGCFYMITPDEDVYGTKLVDNNGFEKTFLGHKQCVERVAKILHDRYGGNDDES